MKLLSIDIGIKNLAFCLIEFIKEKESYNIILWDVINICDDKQLCNTTNCLNDAKYFDKNKVKYMCLKHTKYNEIKIPPKELNEKNIKKMKIDELKLLLEKQNIINNNSNKNTNTSNNNNKDNKKKQTKNDYLKIVNEYLDMHFLTEVKNIKANDVDLIKIGVNMKNKLDSIFFCDNKNYDIDLILIENQISPIANRMKSIQGMITQYFIMKNIENIIYWSATNKLKQFIDDKTTYKERKELSIEYTKQIFNNYSLTDSKDLTDSNNSTQLIELKKWNNFFMQHKKKDDLADSFLQGLSYLNIKEGFNILL
jgi:hypothetical protein